jgi:hypothetical protein
MGTPGQAKSKNKERRQQAMQRRDEILRLKTSGLTSVAIAERLNISARTVDRHLERGLAEVVVAGVDFYRAVAITRLESLLYACWEKAIGGDLNAIHTAARLVSQYARILGLEQPPAKQDDLGDQLAELIKRVAGQRLASERAKTPAQRAQEEAEEAAEAQRIQELERIGASAPRPTPIRPEVTVPSPEAPWVTALRAATGNYDELGILHANPRVPATLPGDVWRNDLSDAAFLAAFSRQHSMSLPLALQNGLVRIVDSPPVLRVLDARASS